MINTKNLLIVFQLKVIDPKMHEGLTVSEPLNQWL